MLHRHIELICRWELGPGSAITRVSLNGLKLCCNRRGCEHQMCRRRPASGLIEDSTFRCLYAHQPAARWWWWWWLWWWSWSDSLLDQRAQHCSVLLTYGVASVGWSDTLSAEAVQPRRCRFGSSRGRRCNQVILQSNHSLNVFADGFERQLFAKCKGNNSQVNM